VRQLEVVAISDDGTYVLLAGDENAPRPTHAVRIDNRLHAAVRGELDDTERRESELSPKEIQARLRAGESAEDVAKAAKIAIARVLRYAGPVLSERDRIVDQARAAVVQRSRGPLASSPLGEIVEKRLAVTAGLRSDSVTWSARRRDDGAWVVTLSYTARGGARSASWLWQPAEQELSSLNNLGTRLGADETATPSRRRRSAPAKAAKAAKPRKVATRRARTPKPVKTVAPKPKPVKVATKAPKPVKNATVPKPKPARNPTAAKRVARDAAAAATPRRTPRPVEPPVIEPPARRVNGRVPVPSWSDVLIGVQAPAVARGRRRS
jgi:hypothetical protein